MNSAFEFDEWCGLESCSFDRVDFYTFKRSFYKFTSGAPVYQ